MTAADAPVTTSSWGFGHNGRLGYDTTDDIGDDPDELGASLPFLTMPTGATIADLSAGEQHSCAVLSDATIRWCVARAREPTRGVPKSVLCAPPEYSLIARACVTAPRAACLFRLPVCAPCLPA